MTSLPTLPPEESQEMILSLLSNNDGCELPCWWGILPGETSWDEAYQFLSTIATRIVDVGNIDSEGKPDKNSNTYVVYIKIPGKDLEVPSGYVITDGIVNTINVSPNGTEIGYQLHQILDRYGTPEEVLFWGLSETSEGFPWFFLILLYPDRGTLAIYEGKADITENQLRVCPQGIGPKLSLWSPTNITLSEMKQSFWDAKSRGQLKHLEEVTGMNLGSFHDLMKNPGSCFISSIETN